MMRTSYLPKTVTLSLTVALLGPLIISSQALTYVGVSPLLHLAFAQESAEHVVHNRPDPAPDINDPDLRVETVYDGLELPTSMAFLGPDDILVAQKDSGIVERIVDGELQDEPVFDAQVANNDERGLLGIAVSDANGTGAGGDVQYVYLYFTESGSGQDGDDWSEGIAPAGTRLYRYNVESTPSEDEDVGNQIHLVNQTLLLDLPATPGPRYHGGPIAIGPDNNVYVVIGDVDHHQTQAQNFENDPAPDGTSGVFRITKDGKVSEIPGIISDEQPLNLYYAYGIRQSFGMQFDPVTGNLWDTENGPDQYDELNLVEPGFNSGWRDLWGLAGRADSVNMRNNLVDFDGRGKYSDPEFTWQQTVAPTGLDFLNPNGLGAGYQNDLFVGDYNNGNLYHFDLNENRTGLALSGGLADRAFDSGDALGDVLFGTGFGGITDVGVGPDGYLYVLTFQEDVGSIFRILPEDADEDGNDNTDVADNSGGGGNDNTDVADNSGGGGNDNTDVADNSGGGGDDNSGGGGDDNSGGGGDGDSDSSDGSVDSAVEMLLSRIL
jgi:glucose/arabinose dehydrogenase